MGVKKQITNSIGMKLTLVPSGEFMMGTKDSAEASAAFLMDATTGFLNKIYGGFRLQDRDGPNAVFFENEHPQHRVRITKPFYLGTYPVTRGQFRQFINDTGYKTEPETNKNPGAWGRDPTRTISSSIRSIPGGTWALSRPTSTLR